MPTERVFRVKDATWLESLQVYSETQQPCHRTNSKERHLPETSFDICVFSLAVRVAKWIVSAEGKPRNNYSEDPAISAREGE